VSTEIGKDLAKIRRAFSWSFRRVNMKFNFPRLIRSRELTNTCQDNVSLLASHLQAKLI
jgi:hypothetical protein